VTAGADLLSLLPAGANIVAEIDVSRLRGNPISAPLLALLTAAERGPEPVFLGVGAEIWARADVVVLAAYEAGRHDAGTLIVARGAGLVDLEVRAQRLDGSTIAMGPPALLSRLAATEAGHSLAADSQLLDLRALAMPEKATGAALRVVARLEFDSRVRLASTLDLDAVPATLSLWGDVADDLALVAVLAGNDDKESQELAHAAVAMRKRLARDSLLRGLALTHLLDGVDIGTGPDGARVIFIVGPQQLARTVDGLVKRLARSLKR
jgi:hypothetical protein